MNKNNHSLNKLHIASLPGRPKGFDGIPYINQFYDALLPYGIEQVCELLPTKSWLQKNQAGIDIVHFHWPEKNWRGEYTCLHRLLKNIKGYYFLRKHFKAIFQNQGMHGFKEFLQFCRKQKIRVVWTLHELEPHSSAGKIDQIGCQLLAEFSDLIISHSNSASNRFKKLYGNDSKLVLMRHGNFKNAYPAATNPAITLQKLALDKNLPTFCLLGALRGYKGVETALQSIALLGDKAQLIIGGTPLPDFPLKKIEKQVQAMPNVRLIARPLSTQEFANLAGCSEAFLLPYTQITTSGVMHAAFTFGAGIVATKLPYFEENLQSNPLCGIMANSNTAEDFAKAMREFLEIPKKERSQAINSFNQQSDWNIVIKPVAEKIIIWKKHP